MGLKCVFLYDFFIGTFYFVLLLLLANWFRKKYVSKNLQEIFKYAFALKLIAALLYILYHQFIFGGGDTFFYYLNGRYIAEYQNWNLVSLVSNLFVAKLNDDSQMLHEIEWVYSLDNFAYNPGLYMIVKISAFLNYFAFNSILSTSLLFATITFFSVWFIFVTFIKVYSGLDKPLAFAFLFYPSIIFWGNSISKDSICICCVSLIFAGFLNLFVIKNYKKKMLGLCSIIISFYILAVVKTYIALSFLPAIILWIGLHFNGKIKNLNIRKITLPIAITIILFVSFIAASNFLSLDARFGGGDTVADKIKIQQTNLQNNAGSAYSLGVDASNTLVLIPFAIAATLFRPFIWEVSNPFMLLSFLESLIITIFCYFIFIKWGFIKAVKAILADNFMTFTIVFTLIFAVGVGSSSGNFGTLVRYKIPCLPFFGATLIILFKKFTNSISYINQTWLHKFLAKYFLGQQPPTRIQKQFKHNMV